MSKNYIISKITELKEQLKEVRGTPCEVFSRVVGYLRPVQNWNKGKQAEFNMRKMLDVSEKTNKTMSDN